MSSLGVMIAGGLIWYGSDYRGNGWFQIADPICTFLFAILVLFTTKQVFAEIVTTIMLAGPYGLDTASLGRALLAIDVINKRGGLNMPSGKVLVEGEVADDERSYLPCRFAGEVRQTATVPSRGRSG